jgi:hypothetical protein
MEVLPLLTLLRLFEKRLNVSRLLLELNNCPVVAN